MDHSSTIYFFPLGVVYGAQREGKECEEMVRTAMIWKMECKEEVTGVSRGGKQNDRRRKKEWNHQPHFVI